MPPQKNERSTGHRNCAVFGCTNSWRQLDAWMGQQCDKHKCYQGGGSCICLPPFSLFPFPTDNKPERRACWIRNLKRENDNKEPWIPKKHHRVCSDHFVDGQPTSANPDPVLKMGYVSSFLKPSRRVLKRKLTKDANNNEITTPQLKKSNIACESFISTENVTDLDHSYTTSASKCIASDLNCRCMQDVCECCSGCLEKASIVKILQSKNEELENKSKNQNLVKRIYVSDTRPLYEKLLTSDKKTKFYTGLPAKALFFKLYQHLRPKIEKMTYWRGKANTTLNIIRKYTKSPKKFGPKRKLLQADELLLTLMKLRLGLLQQDLADRFNVSLSNVSSIFTTWIKVLSEQLKDMIEYPSKEVIISHLPKEAAKFPQLRCIIDCTEVFIERPRELYLQALTWSDYKKHNTVKVLIGITPRGKISFLSDAWGGRASDVHIVNESGFLYKIDPGDQIMADKGFTIEKQLLLRHARLVIPPGVKGQQQMLPEEVDQTKKIANFRIHVERAIGRMKDFNILSNVYPINMLPLIDDVLVTCAALCNFLPPLVTSEYLYM